MISGCVNAKRPFSSLANVRAPWSMDEVEDEALLADTLFGKRRRMEAAVEVAKNGPVEQQQKVAKGLLEIIRRDPVLLLRLHAVNLAAQLRCPAALEALKEASTDSSSDIRIAAVRAWESMPADHAVPQLQEIIGSDTNIDVRLSATKALGKFSGRQAVSAISLALNDTDPALQLRAMESLASASGENLGLSVGAWKDYVARVSPPVSPSSNGSQTRVAEQEFGPIRR
ncbi:HEAT repeat domain-containing protein [Mariniblastus sp.]|nr:HEAT repeat domain-containing protein [Mariniblastus sp.]